MSKTLTKRELATANVNDVPKKQLKEFLEGYYDASDFGSGYQSGENLMQRTMFEYMDAKKQKKFIKEFFTDKLCTMLLCHGFESHMTNWAEIVETNHKEIGARYFHEAPIFKDGKVKVLDVEHENYHGKKRYRTLNRRAIERGKKVFLEKYPFHAADAFFGSDDAVTGDVFIQCCLFGECVYG